MPGTRTFTATLPDLSSRNRSYTGQTNAFRSMVSSGLEWTVFSTILIFTVRVE